MDAFRCKGRGDLNAYTIEHVKPQCQGGTDDAENLRLSHARCNHNRRHLAVRWYPLPCFRPEYRSSVTMLVAAIMHSRYRFASGL